MLTQVSPQSVHRFSRSLGMALTFSLLVIPATSKLALAAEKDAAANEPPAKIIIDPPQPDRLARGVVFIQYRTENLQIMPVFGAEALAVTRRIGHLHVMLDDGPMQWGHTSVEPLILAGLTPGPHKVLIEAVNANHEPLAQGLVEFAVPQPVSAQPAVKSAGQKSAPKFSERVSTGHVSHGSAAAGPASEQPPAAIIVDPPKPGPLARGVVFLQYRTENLQIAPLFGPAAATISPRVGHLHVTVDDLPWHWVNSGGGPVIVSHLPPGPHKITLELADANHQPLGQHVVKFEVP